MSGQPPSRAKPEKSPLRRAVETSLIAGPLLFLIVAPERNDSAVFASYLFWSLLLAWGVSAWVGSRSGPERRQKAYLLTLAAVALIGVANRAADQAELRQDSVEDFIDGANGVVAPTEAECMIDAFADSGVTESESNEWTSDPSAAFGPNFEATLAACFDPTAELSVPLVGQARDSVVDSFVSAGFTRVEAQCFVERLVAAGLDGRDVLIFGLSSDVEAEFEPVLEQAGAECLRP